MGFNICYNLEKFSINKQKVDNLYLYLSILIIPIKIFIKFIIGFFYITIKTSAYLTKELHSLAFYKYDNINYYFNNFFEILILIIFIF